MIMRGSMFYKDNEIEFIFRYAKQKGLNKDEVKQIMQGRKVCNMQVSTLTKKSVISTMFTDIFREKFILDYEERKIIALDGRLLSEILEEYISKNIFDNLIQKNAQEENEELNELKSTFSIKTNK